MWNPKLGGARPGAGRKKGSKNKLPTTALKARRRLELEAMRKFQPLMDTWMNLALGDYYLEGKKTIYKAKPDIKAIQMIMEYVMGKPDQKLELEGELNGTMEVPGVEDAVKAIQEILNSRT